jgi:hypothetical protein
MDRDGRERKLRFKQGIRSNSDGMNRSRENVEVGLIVGTAFVPYLNTCIFGGTHLIAFWNSSL